MSLLLNLNVPRFNDFMTTAIVEAVYGREGDALALGAKFADLTVDLSAAAPHDCPPISHYRLVMRERAWLRRLAAAPGDEPAIGEALALFTTEPDEPIDGPPARALRLAVAAILFQPSWSDG